LSALTLSGIGRSEKYLVQFYEIWDTNERSLGSTSVAVEVDRQRGERPEVQNTDINDHISSGTGIHSGEDAEPPEDSVFGRASLIFFQRCLCCVCSKGERE